MRFNKVQFSSERVSTPLPLSQFPSELSKAWKAELNQPEISDVQFNFPSCDGWGEISTLYARSSILSERSIYFKSMFQQGKWSESKKVKNGSVGSSIGRLLSKKSWNDWSLGKFRKVEDLLEVYKKLKYPNIYNTKNSETLVPNSKIATSFSPAMSILLDSAKDLKSRSSMDHGNNNSINNNHNIHINHNSNSNQNNHNSNNNHNNNNSSGDTDSKTSNNNEGAEESESLAPMKSKSEELYQLAKNSQESLETSSLPNLTNSTSTSSQQNVQNSNDILELASLPKNMVQTTPLELNVPKKYIVTVTDCHPETFKAMLRFLYTNQIDFYPSSSHRRPIDIFIIADKYLITDLRDRAKTKILKDLTPESAIEMLFSFDKWLWEDLKEVIMTYVVRKFDDVKETEIFKELSAKISKFEVYEKEYNEDQEINDDDDEDEGSETENNEETEYCEYDDVTVNKLELFKELIERGEKGNSKTSENKKNDNNK